ncbi:hypothetical protein EX30DRAFT_351262 [Ascodesmis nigricans]|uniref:Uncharacterized protein n=1 Tax=Ascodesmis nigricans TaxID=341454 RepID=A0A4S2MRY7_9PEZI|nr:hypothetical protein EX30DRAFT_351262 [Ascodesmis nigricans]
MGECGVFFPEWEWLIRRNRFTGLMSSRFIERPIGTSTIGMTTNLTAFQMAYMTIARPPISQNPVRHHTRRVDRPMRRGVRNLQSRHLLEHRLTARRANTRTLLETESQAVGALDPRVSHGKVGCYKGERRIPARAALLSGIARLGPDVNYRFQSVSPIQHASSLPEPPDEGVLGGPLGSILDHLTTATWILTSAQLALAKPLKWVKRTIGRIWRLLGDLVAAAMLKSSASSFDGHANVSGRSRDCV